MLYSPRTVFLFSMEPWGDMWYSKHHYAANLARSHTVYFVSLPDKWRWMDIFSTGVKVRSTPEGVKVVEYRNNLPLRILPPWMARSMDRFNAIKLRRLLPPDDVLFWCFHPTRLLNSKSLMRPGSRIIYHVVDPYHNLPNDRPFATRSDLIVAINPWYMDHYGQLNDNCILIPHGVRRTDRELDHRGRDGHHPVKKPYAILATGLSVHVNYALLLKAAAAFPDLNFAIAGKLFPLDPETQAQRDALFAMPNVTLLGVVHPDLLRDLVHGAVVGLLTYAFEPTRSVPIAAGRTPLKVLTYLSQHCPVVSTNNSYVTELDGHGYYKAEDGEHFLALIKEVREGRLKVDRDVVDRYLDGVEYPRLVARIMDRLAELPPVSVETHPLPVGSPQATGVNRDLPSAPKPIIPKGSPVLILSNEAWGGPRYSKHRYALALSRHREVLFLDPAKPWRPSHLFRWRILARKVPEGITVLSYHNAIPLMGGKLRWLNDRFIANRMRSYLRRRGKEAPVFWSFDPSRLVKPSRLGAILSIYHCVDDYAFGWGERSLAQHCDHVFCISRHLMPRFRMLNSSIHFVPHGVAEDDLAPVSLNPDELPAPPGYGLYIGNINDRHDFELWEKLFKAHPEVTWVVVGPVNVTSPLGLHLINDRPNANVRFVGEVPYTRLRTLIAGAAFGFLYMRNELPANRISSQKIVQFLAQGKPLFCSWFLEYADKTDLVYMTDDHSDALSSFAEWQANGERPEAKAERIAFAKSLRFEELLGSMPFTL